MTEAALFEPGDAAEYLRELAAELTAVGIGGRLRRRILAELADHLACGPDADVGSPRELACQFADELGTQRAIGAAYSCFAALAVAGVLFGAIFALAPGKLFVQASGGHAGGVGWWASVFALLGCQVAFVCGVLALARAWRRRREPILPAAEARVLRRRSGLGLLAGALSMAALGLIGIELRHEMAAWWVTLAEVGAGVALAVIMASGRVLLAATVLAPRAPGAAGDVCDDVGPLLPIPLRERPRRLAVWLSLAVAVAITAAGVAQSDPFDGAIRGLLDGTACLVGLLALGPFLGLWPAGGGRRARGRGV